MLLNYRHITYFCAINQQQKCILQYAFRSFFDLQRLQKVKYEVTPCCKLTFVMKHNYESSFTLLSKSARKKVLAPLLMVTSQAASITFGCKLILYKSVNDCSSVSIFLPEYQVSCKCFEKQCMVFLIMQSHLLPDSFS